MEKEIDGGEFTKKEEKPGGENQFITGDPSMITTDEVFALLGEQVVKAKNWAKIALTWNRNFNTLKQSISQREINMIEVTRQNNGLKESNESYKKTNQAIEKRITELNIEIQHKKEEEREAGDLIRELKDSVNNLMKTTENMEKENAELKTKIEAINIKETETKKRKKKK